MQAFSALAATTEPVSGCESVHRTDEVPALTAEAVVQPSLDRRTESYDMHTDRHRYDVVVVGARAAGAATSLLLARQGHDVVLLERATFPADTVSTHQIARTGVVQLRRWGLLQPVLDSGAPALRQVTFTTPGETVTRQIKDKAGVDLLVAPRRHILDTIVAEAAAGAGADLRQGVTVAGVHLDDTGRATGVYGRDAGDAPVKIDARFVVGADGLRSRVARAVGAAVVEDRGAGGSVQYAYYGGIPWAGIELILADRALTGVFPTHFGEACVWVCGPSDDAYAARRSAASREEAFTAQLRRSAPELARRLRAATRTSAVSGMLRTPNFVRQAYGSGWALVGDAGYHRDAVTGHGISDAYRDAEFLAGALDQVLRGAASEPAALAAYQDQRDQALRDVFELTCAMAGFPAITELAELQKQLGRAIDTEAAAMAARPLPGDRSFART
jgi:2-polyprenyl-6-methoxyphenol hydroxylase-like FAD-dependent oxidoreductase